MKTKWLGILFTAAALALAPLSATAENRLPAKFVGDWCEVNHDTGGQNFTRGRCRQEGKINRNGSAITFHVGPLGYQYEGTPCKLLAIAESKKGNYLTIFTCEGSDITSEGSWWSLAGGKLRIDNIVPHKGWHPMDM